VSFGHAGIDAAIGGGLARRRLHEVFAVGEDDSGAAAGFAAMLATLIGRQRPTATIVWLRERLAETRGGCLHAPGLAELGLDPGQVVLGVLDDPLMLLRVAADVARCGRVDVAVIELWRNPRVLDLTASRRLAVAAEQSGVTTLLLRAEAEPGPSAAQTRWQVASAAAAPLEANAPGFPTLELELSRQRGGPAGMRWRVEWDRDQACFREPALSGLVVPLSERRSLAAGGARG
jgi:protein ImuA